MSDTLLKDIRDKNEVLMLSKLLATLAANRIPGAADLMAQRIREVRAAKSQGGSWERAAAVSLLPSSAPSSTLVPDGAMHL